MRAISISLREDYEVVDILKEPDNDPQVSNPVSILSVLRKCDTGNETIGESVGTVVEMNETVVRGARHWHRVAVCKSKYKLNGLSLMVDTAIMGFTDRERYNTL